MLTQFVQQDDLVIVNNVSDVENLLDECRVLRDMKPSKEMRLVAKFDPVIVENYLNQTGISFEEFIRDQSHIRKLVNDPALKAFRVHGGMV